MKTWHIAALVIVGLIVAGIAYTMYEKKNSWKRDLMWRHAQRQMKSEGVPKTNTKVPGLEKVEPERPAAVVGPHTGYEYEAYDPNQEWPEWW